MVGSVVLPGGLLWNNEYRCYAGDEGSSCYNEEDNFPVGPLGD